MKRRLRKKKHLGEFVEYMFRAEAWVDSMLLAGQPVTCTMLNDLVLLAEQNNLGLYGFQIDGHIDASFIAMDLTRCTSLSCPPPGYRGRRALRDVGPTRRKIPERYHSHGRLTGAQREAVEAWLAGDPRVRRFVVYPLENAWI